MAQLGKLVFKIADSAGNALSGVSVEVRKQGAQVNGLHAGANTVFTVDDPGAIVAGDNVKVDTGSVTRSVSSITATTVTVGGAGFSDVNDDSRLTDTTLPTIYNDAIGNETKSNPLTTDAAGEAFCWVVGGKYDVLVSGGGATTKLYTDQAAAGGESKLSTIYSGTAWQLDSLRALAATDEALVISENNDSADLFKVMGDGEIVAGAVGATHTLTGSLSVSTSISAATSMSATTTITAGTGMTATTGNITASTGNVVSTAGNLTAVAGEVSTLRMKAAFGTALTNADFTLSAGWGATASCTFPLGSAYDSRGSVRITSAGAGQAANPTVTLTFKNGAFSTGGWAVCQRGIGSGAGFGGDQPTVPFMVRDITGSTAVTFSFRGTPVAGESYDLWYMVMA